MSNGDPLFDFTLWRLLAHAVVPILIAAGVAPEGSARWRITLSVVAAWIIETAAQVGVDLDSLLGGNVDMTEQVKGTAAGLGSQYVAYKSLDAAVGEDRSLNEIILPRGGVGSDQLDY